jgi:hypothetical protein
MDHAEILASHYTTVLGLAKAAGDHSATDLQGQAIRYLTLAGIGPWGWMWRPPSATMPGPWN